MVRIPQNKSERYRRSVFELMCLRQHFPSFVGTIKGTALTARGMLRTEEGSNSSYGVEVVYAPWNAPEVRVFKPKIEFDGKAHMYKSGNLCLYDWREQPWQQKWHLHETIIPWTAEWLMFYELYQLTGKWLGKSALHRPVPEKVEPKVIADPQTQQPTLASSR